MHNQFRQQKLKQKQKKLIISILGISESQFAIFSSMLPNGIQKIE